MTKSAQRTIIIYAVLFIGGFVFGTVRRYTFGMSVMCGVAVAAAWLIHPLFRRKCPECGEQLRVRDVEGPGPSRCRACGWSGYPGLS